MRYSQIIVSRVVPLCFLAASPIGAAAAWACGLDGVPSLSANGTLVYRNTTPAGAGTLATWAPFLFPRAYRRGQSIRFDENIAEVRRSLVPSAFSRPWRWSFGDGTIGSGATVQHSYRRAGVYKVSVSAYYSGYGKWYAFDAALVRITPSGA